MLQRYDHRILFLLLVLLLPNVPVTCFPTGDVSFL
jgi:hypothetical protein